VLRGKGIVQLDVVEASGYPAQPATRPFPAWQKEWLPFERRLVRQIADRAAGSRSETVGSLATDSQILTNTSLNLAPSLDKKNVRFTWLNRYVGTEADYRRQLTASGARTVLTAETPTGGVEPRWIGTAS